MGQYKKSIIFHDLNSDWRLDAAHDTNKLQQYVQLSVCRVVIAIDWLLNGCLSYRRQLSSDLQWAEDDLQSPTRRLSLSRSLGGGFQSISDILYGNKTMGDDLPIYDWILKSVVYAKNVGNRSTDELGNYDDRVDDDDDDDDHCAGSVRCAMTMMLHTNLASSVLFVVYMFVY